MDTAAYALSIIDVSSSVASWAEKMELIIMQERWLSVGEIAAHLGVNPDTIYKWIDRKQMPAHKLGRLWKFLASEVDAWVKGGKAVGDIAPGSTTTGAEEPPREGNRQ